MQTIAEANGLTRLGAGSEIQELIAAEVTRCRAMGDSLGEGEWLACLLVGANETRADELFARIVALWAAPLDLPSAPSSTEELISRVAEFKGSSLVSAVAAATQHIVHARCPMPQRSSDLAFRLEDEFRGQFGIQGIRPAHLCRAAANIRAATLEELVSAIETFLRSSCTTAKAASVDVAKCAHRMRLYLVAEEKPIISEIDVLLGAVFRKFCEHCERDEASSILRRSADVGENARRALSQESSKPNSTLWHATIMPIAKKMCDLVDEADRRGRKTIAPRLALSSTLFKLDLQGVGATRQFSSRLVNSGDGRATNIQLAVAAPTTALRLELQEPQIGFELAGHSEQLVVFSVVNDEPRENVSVDLRWTCETGSGGINEFCVTIALQQQSLLPDWNRVLQDPPYKINPVRLRENLYGRDAVLKSLIYHAAAGTSTFLWGQKRVGKTSVLQVLAGELARDDVFACTILRMGELGPLHEGQIAHRIAARLCQKVDVSIAIPPESEFGSGLSRLIPFVEDVLDRYPRKKLVVVIDEFDDLNSAFYTGERGRLFVKALRSLSEIGITFFFVGSERMDAIYTKHAIELNKWINIRLDRIESTEDCKTLVIAPVRNVIEYDPACVGAIIEYCMGNPFYMNLMCAEVFKSCLQEQRTFVGAADVQRLQRGIVRALGETNFAHLWCDDPVLDDVEKARCVAENCLVLSCIARLGGSYETLDDVYAAQGALGLGEGERLDRDSIERIDARLRRRGVVMRSYTERHAPIALPVFRDWLREHAELRLLPRWRDYCAMCRREKPDSAREVLAPAWDAAFPISEDDLLGVSQGLRYCGRQKDVSELRVWLRQFDDDIRIDLAFQMLRRLSERGFVTEGAKAHSMHSLEEAIAAKRASTGRGAWTVVRGKSDNLCITYMDSELKSGASTARDLAKRLRPGKTGPPDGIGDWLDAHAEKDALVVVVDDFAGTGRTASAGLDRLLGSIGRRPAASGFLKERRVVCYLLYAFPEAISRLREKHRDVDVVAVNVLGDDVRAFDLLSAIFEGEQEVNFAREVMLQIGRQLCPQNPLGFGDMGALIAFHDSVPNNTLPVFWANGVVNDKPWKPLFPRA